MFIEELIMTSNQRHLYVTGLPLDEVIVDEIYSCKSDTDIIFIISNPLDLSLSQPILRQKNRLAGLTYSGDLKIGVFFHFCNGNGYTNLINRTEEVGKSASLEAL